MDSATHSANLSSNLFHPNLESFSALGHEARLQAFSCMLDLCSHRDHVALYEQLEARLTRDLLTLLPPEIAVMILSYLPLKGMITGMQVCRNWREIISGADPLWRNAAKGIGLSRAIVKTYLPECGSYMELTLRALRHRKCISYVPNQVRAEGNYTTHIIKSAGCYVTCEDRSSSTMTVKRMYNDGSLVSLHTFNSSVQTGPFAPVSNRDFVFWGNSTGWIGWSSTDPPSSLHPPPCKKPRTEDVSDLARIETDTGLHVWSTNELHHCSTDNTAVCPNCSLIAIFGLHVSSDGVASVLLRKLTPGKSDIEVRKCTLQLPKNLTPDPDTVDYFAMMIFPKECEQGVCGSHYLLVDYHPEQLLSLHLVPAELSCVSALPTIRLPTELASWAVPCTLHMDVCSSTDGSVVVFFESIKEQYYVWEPDSGRVLSVCLPPTDQHGDVWWATCTGKLYTILGGENVFAVIGTYTGVVLLKVVYNCDYDCDHISPPADQSWLSTFDTPEHLPIAILFETTNTRASIGSIIGRRRVGSKT